MQQIMNYKYSFYVHTLPTLVDNILLINNLFGVSKPV